MPAPPSSPLLSVGLPVYNGASLLRRAIDSVLGQDFTNLELIISDNASTDATPDIAYEYAAADARVRYIRRPENRGAIDNFGNVLAHAHGRMFSWISHDDSYDHPDHLSRLAQKIDEGMTLAFPEVRAVYFDDEGNRDRSDAGMLAAFRDIRTRHQLIREAVRRPSVQIFGLYRTEKLRQYFPMMIEDADMLCFFEGRFVQAMLLHEPWAYVPEAQISIGQHSSNVSRRQDPRRVLRDYVSYSARALALYRRDRRLTFSERLTGCLETVRVHGPFAARLLGSVIKQRLRSPFASL